jgi:hypothetical protein
LCNSGVVRIPRRFVDRLVSAIYPGRRYRCHSFLCAWEGNIRYLGQPSAIVLIEGGLKDLPERG